MLCACGCGEEIISLPLHKYVGIPKYKRGHCFKINPNKKERIKCKCFYCNKVIFRRNLKERYFCNLKCLALSRQIHKNPLERSRFHRERVKNDYNRNKHYIEHKKEYFKREKEVLNCQRWFKRNINKTIGLLILKENLDFLNIYKLIKKTERCISEYKNNTK